VFAADSDCPNLLVFWLTVRWPATLFCNDSRRGKQESREQGEVLPVLQGKGVVADFPVLLGGRTILVKEGFQQAVTFIGR